MKGYLEEPRRVYKYQNTSIRRAVVLTRWAEPDALPELHKTWREAQTDRMRAARGAVWSRRLITALVLFAVVAGCQWAVM